MNGLYNFGVPLFDAEITLYIVLMVDIKYQPKITLHNVTFMQKTRGKHQSAEIGVSINLIDGRCRIYASVNRRVSKMRAPLAACRKLAGSYNRLVDVLHVFEHKTQCFLSPCSYTRIVVFWHISNMLPWIPSQICYNTPMVFFFIAATFVKYCFTTVSWLL